MWLYGPYTNRITLPSSVTRYELNSEVGTSHIGTTFKVTFYAVSAVLKPYSDLADLTNLLFSNGLLSAKGIVIL